MRIGLLLFFVAFARLTYSQQVDSLFSSNEKFSCFISSFEKKSGDTKLLKTVFQKSHRQFLKKYVAYAQPKNIFEEGNYDCLSGTFFFATIFDRLNVDYTIYETNYHVFIIAQSEKGEVLIESTDPIHGFITDKKMIEQRIAMYRQDKTSSNMKMYLSNVHLFDAINITQLQGLLYFNQAVDAFHKNDLMDCCTLLEKARVIYDNLRIEEFIPILLYSIKKSNLDEPTKTILRSSLLAHQEHAVASLD